MKMHYFYIKKNSGFTLLELMIAMVILAIAFMGILPFFFYSQARLKEATLTNLAMSLIQAKMDRIIHLDYGLIHWQDNPFGDSETQYTYILPEYYNSPCIDYRNGNPCGWHDTATRNMLMDIVELQGYYFTRYIDIDHPYDPVNSPYGVASWESDDYIEPGNPGLPTDKRTLRVTISVYWTVPGGNQHFVRATTLLFDDAAIDT